MSLKYNTNTQEFGLVKTVSKNVLQVTYKNKAITHLICSMLTLKTSYENNNDVLTTLVLTLNKFYKLFTT